MRSAHPPTPHRASWLPRTRTGRWAVGLFAVSVAAVLFMGLAATGPQGGVTFVQNPVMAVPAAVAAASGIASAVLGGYAILRHERAVLVLLSTAAGLNVLAYVAGEAVRPG